MKILRILSFFSLLSLIVLYSEAIDKRAIANNDEANLYVEILNESLALPDKADYTKDFYYQNYMTSLKARDEMPWGNTVPTREFRHFVLPVRVNNENLDTARMVFYRVLKDRVKHLSMKDAILEVNHWCHEKVSYRPTDARTSSPLATVKTAYGRCGEESTFLVAALRSVCIPARQVYTPRWAHTDDNHAWVEAWADGEWHFLGACEPEPVLDLGWFNESASRGMLMHTKVPGNYDGPEEVITRTPCYTEINVTSNYAPTSRVDINVIDKDGNPVPNATVEFKLYNYAEFYTVAQKTTDYNGTTFLSAGHGDLLVWVTKDNLVAVKKVSWTHDHREVIKLKYSALPQHLDIDIVPPQASANLPVVTDEQRSLNDHRKEQEDSIRQAYEATMPVEAWRGNYRTIQQFLNRANNKAMAQKLLDVLSEKDLRDITIDVLSDNEVAFTDTDYIFCNYVLCPRVENELLTPYKAFFRKELGRKISNLNNLIAWTRDSIIIDNENNPQHLRQQPMSVYRTRTSDELGRSIFFVSAARSLGWPVRINEVNGKVEWCSPFHGGNWLEISFEKDKEIPFNLRHKGYLMMNLVQNNRDDLAYYTHFTLSKIVNNKPQLLTYPDDATWNKTFKNAVLLEEGTYLLTTGNRQSNGSVLASTSLFEIKKNEFTNLPLFLRDKHETATVFGSLPMEISYFNSRTGKKETLPQDEQFILGFIAPSNEPTNHALRDISTCATRFEQWGGKIILLNLSSEQERRFNKDEFKALPSTVTWGIDIDKEIITGITEQLKQQSHLPLFMVVDAQGNIQFIKQGYTIHLGEQLLEIIDK